VRQGADLPFHHADEIGAAEIVAVLQAIPGVHELLGEHFHDILLFATVEAAAELEVQHFGIVVLEDHVLDVDAFELLLVLGPLLDIAMELAILRNGVSPELPAAPGFLANLKFDALLFLILGQLHGAGILAFSRADPPLAQGNIVK
jgi:hypothetical protein